VITIASVAVQSVAAAPVKHAVNTAVGVVGVSAAPGYMPFIVGAVSVVASMMFIYKTYQEIKLNNIKLAKEDRRSKPKHQ